MKRRGFLEGVALAPAAQAAAQQPAPTRGLGKVTIKQVSRFLRAPGAAISG